MNLFTIQEYRRIQYNFQGSVHTPLSHSWSQTEKAWFEELLSDEGLFINKNNDSIMQYLMADEVSVSDSEIITYFDNEGKD